MISFMADQPRKQHNNSAKWVIMNFSEKIDENRIGTSNNAGCGLIVPKSIALL